MKMMAKAIVVALLCTYAGVNPDLYGVVESVNFVGYNTALPTLTGMLVCIRRSEEKVVEFTPLPVTCILKNVSWNYQQGVGKCSNQTYQIVSPGCGSIGGACLQGQEIALVTNAIDAGFLLTRDYGKFRIFGSVVNPSNCILGVTVDQFPCLEPLIKTSKITDAQAMEMLDNTLRYHLSPLAAKAKRVLEDAGFILDESPSQFSFDEKGLTSLRFLPGGTNLTDLKLLKDMKLCRLDIAGTGVEDLSPLQGMPLRDLNISNTPVKNVCPLAKLPLYKLCLSQTKVNDISPLVGVPLRDLYLDETDVQDLSPLKGMSLKVISFDLEKVHKGIEVIREMKTLTLINGIRPLRFWSNYEQEKVRTN